MDPHNDDKDRVQQATDIVRLIGEHVALQPKGREHAGLCPFHDDKSPSMFVSPQKQIYKCFSCGAGGDVFSFVMGYHKMGFREALEHLAQRAGIELTRRSPQQAQKAGKRQLLGEANQQAQRFYRHQYASPAGEAARQYVQRRGISDEMVERFGLGYAPDGWSGLADHARQQGWNVEALVAAGLLGRRREGGGMYDRLRHRLTFPIGDPLGRPIAFGGRVLRAEDEPKYLNSPESELFDKSRTLYGLDLAKQAMIAERTAVVVEGYTDVIACHQAGAQNVVATLGTSLTGGHATQLRRFAERVVLVFDPDAAGQKAADRAVELFLTEDIDVAIAVLPGGQDPADLLGADGGLDRWRAALADATDALDHQLHRLRERMDDAGGLSGRQRIAEEALRRLGELGLARSDPMRRAMLAPRLASLLGVPESMVLERLVEAGRSAKVRRSAAAARQQAQEREAVSPPNPEPGDDGAPDLPPDIAAALEQREELPHEAGEPIRAGQDGQPEQQQGVADDVAAGLGASTLGLLIKAQRQVIGVLVRCNDLFHKTLLDGQAVDELLPPEEVADHSYRMLYRRVYDCLAEGEPLPLARLSSDLSAADRQPLVRLLTRIDAELDPLIGPAGEEDPAKAATLLRTAVQAIRQTHDRHRYQQQKLSMLRPPDGDASVDPAAAQRLIEQLRDRPAATRIARVSQ